MSEPTNVSPMNHLRLASANSAPLMTQEQMTNMIVMLTEQVLGMQEDMIKIVEQNEELLEMLKHSRR